MKSLACSLFTFLALSTCCNAYKYEHLTDGKYLSIHVLTVDPKEHAIQPARALKGLEPVLHIAKRNGAVAAINGGFFQENGRPAGILKINNVWYGTPYKPRGAIGWTLNGQKVLMDRVLTNYHFNNLPKNTQFEAFPATTPSSTTAEQWKAVENIVGGSPLLMVDGILINDYSPEKSPESFHAKHPRTAVGIKRTGEWVFVVVDGHIHGFLGGMTTRELARLMLHLGCYQALNLDGGGSSTMVLNDKIINEPHGLVAVEGEAVSDAILIYPNGFQGTHLGVTRLSN